MSIGEILLLAFITIVIFMAIALRPNSKECKLDTQYDYEGFKVSFKTFNKTSEKSTPSDER
jgi:hypothetical protein